MTAAAAASKHLADSMASQNEEPCTKRRKTNYSPQFWNSLSKIALTRRALQELNRRVKQSQPIQLASAKKTLLLQRILRSDIQGLKEYAKNGGPNVDNLRGYANIPASNAPANQLSSELSQSQPGSMQSETRRSSIRLKSTGLGKTINTISTYGAEFSQRIMDSGIYPKFYEDAEGCRMPDPNNVQEIRDMLGCSRQSVSPLTFPSSTFERFQHCNNWAISDSNALAEVITIITGVKDEQFYSASTIPFNRLAKLDPELPTPKPDKYYGARPDQIHKHVRNHLNRYIIPSNSTSRPAAPNFFLEGKSTWKMEVVQRQAIYNGWVGARGMFQLQNYKSAPTYDGNAYTISAAYHPATGLLEIYAMHPRESSSSMTEYSTTQLRVISLTNTLKSFRKGITAYRNAREWTQQQRDRFIAKANAAEMRMSDKVAPVSQIESTGFSYRREGTSVKGVENTKGYKSLIDTADTLKDDVFFQKIQSRLICRKYSLIRKLGEGGFGVVYLGREIGTGKEVALKLEHRYVAHPILRGESRRYEALEELTGFPEMYWCGWRDDFNVMVFELLGPSLGDLLAFCDGRFSLKTTLLIMDQLLTRLESLHSNDVLHRDVKPENSLLGCGLKGSVVYLTDLGLAMDYVKGRDYNNEARPRRARLVGTMSFASIRAHEGYVQSPADDLESLGYMMIYFMQGHLPWQGLKVRDTQEEERAVLEKKAGMPIEDLCRGLPREFAIYMKYVRSLRCGNIPDYNMLREIFRRLARQENIDYDDVFDWTIRLYFERKRS